MAGAQNPFGVGAGGGWSAWWGFDGEAGGADDATNSSLLGIGDVCTLPCSVLGAGLTLLHLVAPSAIATVAWLCASLPTVLLRRRMQFHGLRACLWPLLQLWLHLILAYAAFRFNPVWGFAWALHAPAQILTSWAPPRRVLALQGLHPWFVMLGVGCVWLYAWNIGAPAGLVRWKTGAQSQCGWAAHLVAVTGVDLVTGMAAPLAGLVMGGRC